MFGYGRTLQEGLKHILQDFSGVERVSVEYNTAVTRENWATTGLRNKGVCSDDGTNVTVIFESVSLEVGHDTIAIIFSNLNVKMKTSTCCSSSQRKTSKTTTKI